MANNNMRNLDTAWATNESLLQSYRQIFIGSQAFMLAVGAILLDKDISWLLWAIATLSIVVIWFIWFRVVRSRALIVDYYKFQLITPGICSHPDFITEHEYVDQKSRFKRYAMNNAIDSIKRTPPSEKVLKPTKNWRPTRWKVDLGLPIIFTMMWVFLLIAQQQSNIASFICSWVCQ